MAACTVSGLAAGVAIVCVPVFTGRDPVWGVNAGIVALAANLVVAPAVTCAGPPDRDPRPDEDVLAEDPLPEADRV